MSFLKLVLSLFVAANYIVFSTIGRLIYTDPIKRKTFCSKIVNTHCRVMVKVLGIELQIEGLENLDKKNYLLVANHLSYLDIFVINALRPVCFVTSMEMRNAGFLGLMTRLADCLFVERRTREKIISDIEMIAEALRQGATVVIFPEATSTDGSRILPFKRSLLAAAIAAEIPVLPVVIQYESVDGQKVTVENRDQVCWYGDMGFSSHYLGLLQFKQVRTRMRVLPEIAPEPRREVVSGKAFEQISRYYQPIV